MRDNVPAPQIASWLHQNHQAALKAIEVESILPKNISEWRCGGYKEWEARQHRLEEMQAQREFALELAQHSDGSVQASNVAIAASHIYEVLQDFDIQELKKKLQEKPELYGLLLQGISQLSRVGVVERKLQLELTKYQDKVAEIKRKIAHELAKAKKAGGISGDTIAKIEEALNLL